MSSEHSVLHPPTDRPFACSLSFTLFLHHPIRRYEICAIAHNRKREMHVPWLYDYPATQHDNVPPLIRFVFFLYFFVCLLHLSRCSLLLSFVDHLHAWNARVCCVYVCGLWYIIIIIFLFRYFVFGLCSRFNCFVAAAAAAAAMDTQHNNNYLDFNEYKWLLGFFFPVFRILMCMFSFSFLFSITCSTINVCVQKRQRVSVEPSASTMLLFAWSMRKNFACVYAVLCVRAARLCADTVFIEKWLLLLIFACEFFVYK